ncbi:RagB/SusD family nutrient uptake outer membrane protein [Negadavirga shengliensis]|uniref:RagB/SusD family nutrient uptake outer membrane protein n=1 Tax=Negadavirga shengliensis TaxID=1389218 RepID=A0ABV9T0H0_9BACT
MKKSIISYIPGVCLVCLGLLVASCEGFLAENPKNRVDISNYYSSEQDAIAAVNAIYAYLGSYDASAGNTAGIYHSTFWVTQGLSSDEMNNNQLGALHFDQLETFTHNSENAALLEIWRMHYKTIYMANIAIARIPDINMNETLRTRLVNEAKFLRALLYFNLVRMFDRIPLLVNETEPLTPEAAETSAIYGKILQDLTDAENLPLSYSSGAGRGRATSGAAKTLLAKVYLTLGDYGKCAEKAAEVIESGQYELWEDFSEVFRYANRGGKEAVFSVGFGDAGGAISFWEVGQFNVRLLPTELSSGFSNISNTQGWQVATQDLYNSYSPQDTRRDATFMIQFTNEEGAVVSLDKIYFQKYWDREANPNAGGSENDFQVLRYADVLLMYAEALAELGDFTNANNYLNRVRNRAGLPGLTITNIADFKEAVLLERRKEFAVEGHRWFDLVRMGKLQEKVQLAKEVTPGADFNLFPIPLRERDLNPNLPQNPGF